MLLELSGSAAAATGDRSGGCHVDDSRAWVVMHTSIMDTNTWKWKTISLKNAVFTYFDGLKLICKMFP
jgi:hypothetical protein